MSTIYEIKGSDGRQGGLTEREVPQPGPGQLGVKVHAAGVNPFDNARRGDVPTGAATGQVSGVVTELGEGAGGFEVGEAVLGPVAAGATAFAQDTLVEASETVAKPEEVSFTAAAALPIAGALAYAGTHVVELDNGQSLLISGAGGATGLMAAQIGRVHEFVVVGVDEPAAREAIEATGATFVEAGDGAVDAIRAALPDGADLVLDLVGGDALRAVAPAAVKPDRVLSAADADTVTALGGTPVRAGVDDLEKITGVVSYEVVDPLVVVTYPLDRTNEALDLVESGTVRGNVVVEVVTPARAV